MASKAAASQKEQSTVPLCERKLLKVLYSGHKFSGRGFFKKLNSEEKQITLKTYF